MFSGDIHSLDECFFQLKDSRVGRIQARYAVYHLEHTRRDTSDKRQVQVTITAERYCHDPPNAYIFVHNILGRVQKMFRLSADCHDARPLLRAPQDYYCQIPAG